MPVVPAAGGEGKGLQREEAQGTCISFLHPFSRQALLQSDPPIHQQLRFPPLLETLKITQYLPELRCNHTGGQRSVFANVSARVGLDVDACRWIFRWWAAKQQLFVVPSSGAGISALQHFVHLPFVMHRSPFFSLLRKRKQKKTPTKPLK